MLSRWHYHPVCMFVPIGSGRTISGNWKKKVFVLFPLHEKVPIDVYRYICSIYSIAVIT